MAQRPEQGLDDWTRQLITSTRQLIRLGMNGVTSTVELSRRLSITPNNLGNYLRPDRRGYGPWTVFFADRVASAFGLSLLQLLHHAAEGEPLRAGANENGTYAWQPDSDRGGDALERFEQHEQRAREGIGMFRIPPCAITPPEGSRIIRRNCFAPYGAAGERAARSYEEIESHYRDEYEQCEGHYAGFNVTSLVLESDMQRLIRSEGEFTGCWRIIQTFLEQLRNHHIREFDYKIGFIDDDKVPGEVLRELAGADSIVLVGTTLGVRRGRHDFQLRFADQGLPLMRDQSTVRTLLRYADLARSTALRKVEGYMRQADRAVKIAHANERAGSY